MCTGHCSGQAAQGLARGAGTSACHDPRAPNVNKGKGVASSSHGAKRARRPSEEEHEDVRMAPPPKRQYGLRWFTEQEDRILTLVLGFVIDAPGDCNLNMVREFLENWMPKERSNQVKIRGQIIEFAPMDLNRLLGTPNVDPQPFVNIVKKPLYRDIRHTLCGPNSVARMPVNVGVLIKNVLKRARVKKGQNFVFGGLLTRFLCGHDIEEEEANYKPSYDPRRIDLTKIKEPEVINGPVLSFNERNARIDNS
ncbi:hypothetical protein HAX54_002188 [Datura stramonium]|uniref:Uncharacterized protein n=1 Tax=Datura stramonium TaxID=4076 RepID=A0ABS8RIB4_DATST|nr:hypothetical protein [Datura stramonium]